MTLKNLLLVQKQVPFFANGFGQSVEMFSGTMSNGVAQLAHRSFRQFLLTSLELPRILDRIKEKTTFQNTVIFFMHLLNVPHVSEFLERASNA